MIVRIYDDSDGRLLGECITKDGYYYITADSDNPGTPGKEGAAENAETVIKLSKNGREYILYTDPQNKKHSVLHKSGTENRTKLYTKEISF